MYTADDLDNAFIGRWFHTHPADFNQNSIVDAADFTVWRNTLGSTYDLRADADDGTGTGTPDGVVDQLDYNYWAANFGAVQQRVGRGHPITNDGRGMFNIVQNDPSFFNVDGSIGFSLITSKDIEFLCVADPMAPICANPNQSGGLIMNNGAGTSASANVDTFDPGTTNLVEIADEDLDDWHEFWITIEEDGAVGTHKVKVYMDGSTNFSEFRVTVNSNGDSEYIDDAWLTMGLSDTDLFVRCGPGFLRLFAGRDCTDSGHFDCARTYRVGTGDGMHDTGWHCRSPWAPFLSAHRTATAIHLR